jgi:hypothetical protein
LPTLTPDHEGQHTGTAPSAFEAAPLVVGQPTPDSRVRTGVHGPSQTGVNDLAATTDGLCLLDLEEGGPGASDREEQFGVLAQARRAVTPRHLDQASWIVVGKSGSCESAQTLGSAKAGLTAETVVAVLLHLLFFHLAACEFDASADIKHQGSRAHTRRH